MIASKHAYWELYRSLYSLHTAYDISFFLFLKYTQVGFSILEIQIALLIHVIDLDLPLPCKNVVTVHNIPAAR